MPNSYILSFCISSATIREGKTKSSSCATIQILHNNALISITYISHPHYSRPPNNQQEAFNGAVKHLSAFNMSSLLCLTEFLLLLWQILPITDEIMDIFRLAPGECGVEMRMKTIKEWSENEGRRGEKRRGEWRKRGRELEEKRVMSLPLDGSQSEEGRGSKGARRGCVFLALQHQQWREATINLTQSKRHKNLQGQIKQQSCQRRTET